MLVKKHQHRRMNQKRCEYIIKFTPSIIKNEYQIIIIDILYINY
jgi:hypothetical protein